MSRLVKGSRQERQVFIRAGILSALLLFIDQLTKLWVVKCFELRETMEIIPGFFSFTSVRNPGAAWSILSGYSWLLLVFGIIGAAALLWFFRYLADGFVERYYALLAVLAGIIGNSIDRLCGGAVIDFLDVHWKTSWQYPIFNVADVAICCGMTVFVISNFFRSPDKKESSGE